jgi:hypothetical protein
LIAAVKRREKLQDEVDKDRDDAMMSLLETMGVSSESSKSSASKDKDVPRESYSIETLLGMRMGLNSLTLGGGMTFRVGMKDEDLAPVIPPANPNPEPSHRPRTVAPTKMVNPKAHGYIPLGDVIRSTKRNQDQKSQKRRKNDAHSKAVAYLEKTAARTTQANASTSAIAGQPVPATTGRRR